MFAQNCRSENSRSPLSPALIQIFVLMDTKEETRECGQCHKMVAEANFALHETHCRRFLCLCPDCEETVPREQLDQHRKEQHTLVKCSKCNKKVERCDLLEHQSDVCAQRLQTCLFCELELPWKDLDQHQQVCGSRTELCGDCGLYVTLRDQAEHDLSCPASSAPSPADRKPAADTASTKVRCDGSTASVPAEDIEKHKLICPPSAMFDELKMEPERSRRQGGSPSSTQGPLPPLGRHDMGTCPHCHLTLPAPTLLWHQVKCQRFLQRR